jgi:4-hydroxybenzoate polyprenyltransferase
MEFLKGYLIITENNDIHWQRFMLSIQAKRNITVEEKAKTAQKIFKHPGDITGHPVTNNSMSRTLNEVIKLLRPKQWIKNMLVFAGLIFSFNLFNPPLVLTAMLAFISFCLLSSGVYVLNDMIDIEEDRTHPKNKHRPLAAGTISVKNAILLLIVLLVISLALAWLINLLFFIATLIYLFLNVSYSLWLKHMVILDVFAIAFGFLIRALAGAIAIDVNISPWFLVCTLLLSLFLALAKRRQESKNLVNNGVNHRKVLEHYPIKYLDQLIAIVTASTIIGYSLYTFTASHTELFMLTIPFVIYGIFRYLYLVYAKDMGDSPDEVLLQDKPLIINILAWVVISVIILSLESGSMF